MFRRTTLRRRVAVAATVGAGLAVMLGPVTPAQAIPSCKYGYQCTYTYYSSASMETVVGGHTRFCDGTTDTFGTTSRWLQFTTAKCNDPV
ncbi:hypothetical protein GCM10027290_02880 [Micromonospora sonneratiae]|uniref:DUF6289 family protein n=1 Tax=Micromonospora sonneratiae TaxID=1184706 RepID=A0ABW3Y7N0_9ACTN